MRRAEQITRRGVTPRVASLAVAVAIVVPGVQLSTSSAEAAVLEEPVPEDDHLSQAANLYKEGETLYSAAEYTKAVEKWTEALDIIMKNASGTEREYQIRGALLFNIAKGRVNAYDVTGDIADLRKGRAIYQRYVEEAEKGSYPESDVSEANREIEALDARIEELEAAASPPPGPAPGPIVEPGPQRDLDAELALRKRRGVGIGLMAGGGLVTVGGVAAIIYGSFFEQWAEDDIRRNDSDPDTFDADEQAYLDSEKRKGVIWMGVGGGLLAVGVGGIAGGAVVFSKANRKLDELQGLAIRDLRATPVVSRDFAGLSLTGRF